MQSALDIIRTRLQSRFCVLGRVALESRDPQDSNVIRLGSLTFKASRISKFNSLRGQLDRKGDWRAWTMPLTYVNNTRNDVSYWRLYRVERGRDGRPAYDHKLGTPEFDLEELKTFAEDYIKLQHARTVGDY